MNKKIKTPLNLRRLILILCIFSVVVTLLNAFYSVYRVNRDDMLANAIESNRVYAEKMAYMTDAFLSESLSQLKFSATELGTDIDNQVLLDEEVERVRAQSNAFNSVAVVNTEGIIRAISPPTIEVKGAKLTSPNSLEPLNIRTPYIVEPFVSPAGNYLLGVSAPIFSESRQYLGYIIGTIYLEEDNALSTLLGKHAHEDGSYLYVVNKNSTLIAHPDSARVGEKILNNAAIEDLVNGVEGGRIVTNSQGVDMLAGYAIVDSSGWGIVTQKAKQLTLSNLNKHMWKVVMQSIPIIAMTFLCIWIFSFLISKPLWQLASTVRKYDSESPKMNELDKVNPWYFEAANLKQSLVRAFSSVSDRIEKLHVDSLTDTMTGLLNRRGWEQALVHLSERYTSFSLLAIDIDHFKKINDTYGHDVGDTVIKEVAKHMADEARNHDVLCRHGGEEFLVLLVNTNLDIAFEVAERIRKSINTKTFTDVDTLSVSIGVSSWKGSQQPIDIAIKAADKALYNAKYNGRNRTEIEP